MTFGILLHSENRNKFPSMTPVAIPHQRSECGIACSICGAFVPLPAGPSSEPVECRECGYHVEPPETSSI